MDLNSLNESIIIEKLMKETGITANLFKDNDIINIANLMSTAAKNIGH